MDQADVANVANVRGCLGVIAGSGLYSLGMLTEPQELVLDTDYGPARCVRGLLHGRGTVFITRHGADHSVPPHLVNYRANISALASLGVTDVLAVNVVGGIGHDSGALVVVDDFIDFTTSRTMTFFDGSTAEGVVHVDMTEPYDEGLRAVWITAAESLGIDVTGSGVYGAFEGPRFETRAEIRMARAMGVTVVGMTGVPEVVLAKERGLRYAAMCLVANPAAGLGPPIEMSEILAVVGEGTQRLAAIIDEAARMLAS